MPYLLLQTRNEYFDSVKHTVQILFIRSWSNLLRLRWVLKPVSKYAYFRAEVAYFIGKGLPEQAAKHWGVFSPLDCRLACLQAGYSLTDTFQTLNPGLHWWKFSALKCDTSLFLWPVLTLTPASPVLYSVTVCWKPNFQPRFLLKCAPPLARTDVFAATLVQVNNHNSKVHAGFRVYPLELSKCSFQALIASLMCVCRCQLCWSMLAGIHGCTGLMNMATGGWIAGAGKLPFFLLVFSFLELFAELFHCITNTAIFHSTISITTMTEVLICHGFDFSI